jgi:NAD(P)-dependent dehydrogenase (short-subunit alcohol dehydrogenase family)
MPAETPIEIPVIFPQPGDVAGRRVMITGAGRGLGSVVATAFSHAGARVALVARTQDELEKLASRLPNESLVLAADVSDADANVHVCEQIDEAWGGLDTAILNAGISPSVEDPLLVSSRMWRKILDVNLNGVFFGARAAAAVMRDGGSIIATGSVLADRPRLGLTAYNTSKAGVIGLVKSLAVDLAGRGITVNAVAPGWFESPLAAGFMADEALSRAIVEHTAAGRWGRSEDIAGAYLFLASPAASYITGSVIAVDGGYLLV